jgi:hypothetical protein
MFEAMGFQPRRSSVMLVSSAKDRGCEDLESAHRAGTQAMAHRPIARQEGSLGSAGTGSGSMATGPREWPGAASDQDES